MGESSFRFEAAFELGTGEGMDYSAHALSGSLLYQFAVFDGFYFGPLVGYRFSFGTYGEEGIENVDPGYVPVAGSMDLRLIPSAKWLSFGGDVGHAFSMDDALRMECFTGPV